jgi:hypothetical protein
MKRCSGGSMKMIDFWNPVPDLIMFRWHPRVDENDSWSLSAAATSACRVSA